ncbi:TlpA family protein disulfide reductase [Enterovibrio sp. ZSDZ35]|uniref:TlpA family protein disulfide reductase n=1 Tax=Enterovibrio qingdaonensis TaxID=2899818 RepID=A0ABT5QJB3_9GAMM|nr:TlpA disulfide reductase family protein [Enterovibrio sp. ZSDZ35]MDD1781074.1 TlpA family protein disulfide reductase [Enterovibrio sp. ZSDZ35]
MRKHRLARQCQAIAVVLGGLFSNAYALDSQCKPPTEFHAVKPYALPADLHGESMEKVSLVNFWAVWCGPCLKELPMLSELAASSRTFDVKTLHVGDNEEAINGMFSRLAITNLANDAIDDFEAVRALGFVGLPATLVTVNNKVTYHATGYLKTSVNALNQWLQCLGESA